MHPHVLQKHAYSINSRFAGFVTVLWQILLCETLFQIVGHRQQGISEAQVGVIQSFRV